MSIYYQPRRTLSISFAKNLPEKFQGTRVPLSTGGAFFSVDSVDNLVFSPLPRGGTGPKGGGSPLYDAGSTKKELPRLRKVIHTRRSYPSDLLLRQQFASSRERVCLAAERRVGRRIVIDVVAVRRDIFIVLCRALDCRDVSIGRHRPFGGRCESDRRILRGVLRVERTLVVSRFAQLQRDVRQGIRFHVAREHLLLRAQREVAAVGARRSPTACRDIHEHGARLLQLDMNL